MTWLGRGVASAILVREVVGIILLGFYLFATEIWRDFLEQFDLIGMTFAYSSSISTMLDAASSDCVAMLRYSFNGDQTT